MAKKRVARRKRAPGAPKRKPFQAQAILLEQATFSVARAKAWLKRNGHKYGTIYETEDGAYYHAEQHDPADYQKGTLHMVEIAKHVLAVVGIPKGATDASEQRGYNARGPRQGRLFSGGSTNKGREDDVVW